MTKKTSLITILSTVIIVVALIGSLWLDNSLGSRLVNVVTIITAVIGAIALFLQFKKDKQINTASFLLEYSKSFYNEYNLLDIFSELDKVNPNKDYKFDFEKYQAKIVVYLEWIESLASLIERNVLDFYTIDNILSYRFFIIVNNKQVQDNELIPCSDYYRGVFYLYDLWYKFELKRNIAMPLFETALHLNKNYNEIIKKVNATLKNK